MAINDIFSSIHSFSASPPRRAIIPKYTKGGLCQGQIQPTGSKRGSPRNLDLATLDMLGMVKTRMDPLVP